MKMKVTLGNPLLIVIYSTALLFIGAGVGVHWLSFDGLLPEGHLSK